MARISMFGAPAKAPMCTTVIRLCDRSNVESDSRPPNAPLLTMVMRLLCRCKDRKSTRWEKRPVPTLVIRLFSSRRSMTPTGAVEAQGMVVISFLAQFISLKWKVQMKYDGQRSPYAGEERSNDAQMSTKEHNILLLDISPNFSASLPVLGP